MFAGESMWWNDLRSPARRRRATGDQLFFSACLTAIFYGCASGVNEPFVKDFMAVYTDLFGMLTNQPSTADQTAAIMRARARNQSILDFVKGDIATFRTRINSADKAHMDAYLYTKSVYVQL